MHYHDKRYFNIPHFDNYMISTDGIVINKGTLKPLKNEYMKTRGFVTNLKIKDSQKIRISINELFVSMYYGITNLPILERIKIDAEDAEYLDHKNVYYDNTLLLDIDYKNTQEFKLEKLLYRVIPGTDNEVFINIDGAVYDFRQQMFRPRSYGIKDPYPMVYFNKKAYTVHRLLARVFLDNFDEALQVNHKDGKMYNSYLSNLEMVTHQENIMHASEMGLIKGRAYSPDAIHEICKMLEGDKNINEIKEAMHLHDQDNDSISRLIWRITSGAQWKEVASLYDLSKYDRTVNRTRKFSEESIHKVCQLLQDTNMTNNEIVEETGVKRDTIQSIRAGKQWLDIRNQYNIEYSQTKYDFPKENFHQIGKLMEEGYSNNEIMRETKYTNAEFIAKFRSGELYPDISSHYDIPQTIPRDYLVEDEVRIICEKICEGLSDIEIHREFFPDKYDRFSQSISDIRKGKVYTYISSEYGLPNDELYNSMSPRNYITPELKDKILSTIKNNPGLTNPQIADMVCGVPWYIIRNYRRDYKCSIAS